MLFRTLAFLACILTVLTNTACQKSAPDITNPDVDPPPPGQADTTSFPPSGNTSACKIQRLVLHSLQDGSAGSTLDFQINSRNEVTHVKLWDPRFDNSNNIEFSPVYLPGRIQVSKDDFFVINTDGTVKEFHGRQDLYPTNRKRVNRYEYDHNRYLKKITSFEDSVSKNSGDSTVFTWKDGNLEKMVFASSYNTRWTEYEYHYDMSKSVKGFYTTLPYGELLYFQSFVDYGNQSKNVPVQVTTKVYDYQGLLNSFTGVISNYVIDTDGYVREFEIRGANVLMAHDTRYKYTYKCP